jgi:hypothetical protein
LCLPCSHRSGPRCVKCPDQGLKSDNRHSKHLDAEKLEGPNGDMDRPSGLRCLNARNDDADRPPVCVVSFSGVNAQQSCALTHSKLPATSTRPNDVTQMTDGRSDHWGQPTGILRRMTAANNVVEMERCAALFIGDSVQRERVRVRL